MIQGPVNQQLAFRGQSISTLFHNSPPPPPFRRDSPPVGQGLLIHEVSRSHTTAHHIRYDSSGRLISPSQRPLLDNTQHSQQTNIHAPGGIRTQSLSRREAADLSLRPCGHWDGRAIKLVP